jgi:1-acyl-sn-glycerol-3-phosphate acyltransferase
MASARPTGTLEHPAARRAGGKDALPTFSPRIYRGFLVYLRRYLRRHFNAVRLAGPLPLAPGDPRSCVVYSNHPSWWDPLMFMILSDGVFPGRAGYGPMDAAALERHRFFKRLGMFGVDPDSRRGAAAFLRNGLAVLERPRSNLWVTAEGQFRDARQRPIRLKPGLAHLALRARGVLLVPLALEYTFWNERHPEALLRFGEPIGVDAEPEADLESWTRRLEQGLESTMDLLSRDARSRDPQRFESLLSGNAGVGGVYDAWRRLRARFRGETFRAAHGDGR